MLLHISDKADVTCAVTSFLADHITKLWRREASRVHVSSMNRQRLVSSQFLPGKGAVIMEARATGLFAWPLGTAVRDQATDESSTCVKYKSMMDESVA